MWFSLVTVVVNIAASLLFFPVYGHVAIAAATSLSAWVNVLLLAVTLWRRGDFPSSLTLRRIAFMLLASAVMGVVVWGTLTGLPQFVGHDLLFVRILTVVAIVVLAAVAYFGVALATGGIDRKELARARRRDRKNVSH